MLMTCARSFGAVLEINDLDLSVYQEALTVRTTDPSLEGFVADAVAHLCEMMTETQREWKGFERWYKIMMEFAVFGSSENPIEVEGFEG